MAKKKVVQPQISRRLGLGLLTTLSAGFVLVGCAKEDGRIKSDRSQIADEQAETQLGKTQEQLVVTGTLWEDQFTTFNAQTSTPGSSSSKWYIQQHFKPNGEVEDYNNTVCGNGVSNGSGTVVDSTNWAFCIQSDGGGGNGVVANSSDGKALQVRAHRNGSGVVTSGRLNSKRFAEFAPTASTPLKLSARIKMPVGAHGNGFWPAVWFLQRKINEAPIINDGDTVSWPCDGAHEVDLFEHGSQWAANYNKSSMHYRTGTCIPQSVQNTLGSDVYAGANLDDGKYHTYTWEWETRKARFYLDGVQYGPEQTTTGLNFETTPMFWIINVAAGGNLGGGFDGNYFTGDTKSIFVDYLRVETLGAALPTARNMTGSPPAITMQAETNDGMLGMQAETTTDVGGGQDMGFIDPTDWVEWYVNVPTTAQYYIQTRNAVSAAAGTPNAAQYRIRVDGQQVTTVQMSGTGGWQNWGDNYSQAFTIAAGNHHIRFEADTAGQNLNWVKLSGGTSGNSCSDMVQNGNETGIDCGGSCAACPSCSNGVKDSFASQNWYETGVDCGGPCVACGGSGPGAGVGSKLEGESAAQSGFTMYSGTPTYMGNFDTGDYLKWTGVDMTSAKGMHLQIAALNGGGKLDLRLDSPTGTSLVDATNHYTVQATGGWTTFVDQQVNFAVFSSGVHDIYLKGESGSGIGNIDNITLTSSTNQSGQGTAFPEVISNPNFDMALSPTGTVQGWLSFFNNGGTFTSNNGWGRVTVTAASGVMWHSHHYQTKVSDGSTYTWKCDFHSNKANTAKTVEMYCEQNATPYTNRGLQSCTAPATGGFVTCTATCTPPAGETFAFGIRGGQDTTAYDFDSCVLTNN